MFQTLDNLVRIDFLLVPEGPVLVRSGGASLDPGIADMEFQRTTHGGRRTVFLAGSGLKGVLRAHCERLLNSLGVFACDPTKPKKVGTREKDFKVCSNRRMGKSDKEHPHAGQCAACFTFGSLELAGRFRASDAYPREDLWEEANATEARTQVGLDRKSQGPANGTLFNCEVVVGGGFEGSITGESFSLWQLALVLQALADLDDGLVRVGGAKARGMGSVKVRDLAVEMRFLDRDSGHLTGARQRNEGYGYGLPTADRLPCPAGGEEASEGLFRAVRFGGPAVANLHRELVESCLRPYLKVAS